MVVSTVNTEKVAAERPSCEARHLVTDDGLPLVKRRYSAVGLRKGTAFVAHSQAQHSLNIEPTVIGIAQKGWEVHVTDLRGHGHSCSSRAPLAHMEVGTGWERLIGDMRLALSDAFAGVAWEDRLVVAPNISAPLVLDVLKSWPDLASRIVLCAPAIVSRPSMMLARSFLSARLRFRPANQPDEMTLHHLFAYLGAQVPGYSHMTDVVTSDKAIIAKLLADPLGFPTPTTGYFYEMFRGIGEAWHFPKGCKVRRGTQLLILYGSEDAITQKGRLLAGIDRDMRRIGFADVSMMRIEGGRGGMIIDETRLGISAAICGWADGHAPGEAGTPPEPPADTADTVLGALALDAPARELAQDELVELCYHAISDETRWIELMYRITHAISDGSDLSDETVEQMIHVLMPHWERSFGLNRQIMEAAAVGTVLQNVVERFGVGVAIVDRDFRILYANTPFAATLPGFAGLTGTGATASKEQLTAGLARLIDSRFREEALGGTGEALLTSPDGAAGFHFRPPALRQTALVRGGAHGVILMHAPADKASAEDDDSIELLQLAYGLTAREAETAKAVMLGLGPEAIARNQGVSINTVKTHLKRIFEKTGAQSQSELASRLLRGPVGLLIR